MRTCAVPAESVNKAGAGAVDMDRLAAAPAAGPDPREDLAPTAQPKPASCAIALESCAKICVTYLSIREMPDMYIRFEHLDSDICL